MIIPMQGMLESLRMSEMRDWRMASLLGTKVYESGDIISKYLELWKHWAMQGTVLERKQPCNS